MILADAGVDALCADGVVRRVIHAPDREPRILVDGRWRPTRYDAAGRAVVPPVDEGDATVDLARRAVACPGWRWMDGMKVQLGPRIDGDTVIAERDDVPDLADPATLGCLLALVRDAWGDPTAWVESDPAYWVCRPLRSGAGRQAFIGVTEAAALVAALEAAP